MSVIHNASRALAPLVTTALAAGLAVTAAPAMASSNDHAVAVHINSTSVIPGWRVSLLCTRPDGSTYSPAAVSATPHPNQLIPVIPDYYEATFTHVPDGVCGAQATNPLGGTGSVSGVSAADGALLSITPDSTFRFACAHPGVITGSSVVGQTLTASSASLVGGLGDPAARVFSWYRSGVAQPVQRSASSSYVVSAADAGHQLSVVESDSLLGLSSLASLLTAHGSVICAAASTTLVLANDPTPASAPTIQGKAVVGHRLVADAAVAPAGATITGYQWYQLRATKAHQRRNKERVAIKGAHHRSLRMKERLAGHHVLVGVTYTLPGHRPVTVFSKAVKVNKERNKE
ncbi:hypothetical protein D9V37_11945 [Nocardioides mangrovicus]|uniref:Ig-like domain-containing protein n=1 Tax=Nocardioides mangrovicus TaxID=2478913 RepID=A0A3L8P2R0_9ACTN|nr:hypothetical protein [Nocardioides mangrovicus]RLV49252.1 hypothetical protein D9V37_11945 [Nocardioides mangrovicus]